MSTLRAPSPSMSGAKTRPNGAVATRRTVIGFVATRWVVEVILAVILGAGSGLIMLVVTVGDFVADPKIAARHIDLS